MMNSNETLKSEPNEKAKLLLEQARAGSPEVLRETNLPKKLLSEFAGNALENLARK